MVNRSVCLMILAALVVLFTPLSVASAVDEEACLYIYDCKYQLFMRPKASATHVQQVAGCNAEHARQNFILSHIDECNNGKTTAKTGQAIYPLIHCETVVCSYNPGR